MRRLSIPGGVFLALAFVTSAPSARAATDLTQIWTGVDHTCAVTAAGDVSCWGRSAEGEAGTHPGPFTQVSAGGHHDCALTETGAADCWGENTYGESTDQPGPYALVVAGWMHTCALTLSGAADCWGRNDFGQSDDQPGPFTDLTISGGRTPRRGAGSRA